MGLEEIARQAFVAIAPVAIGTTILALPYYWESFQQIIRKRKKNSQFNPLPSEDYSIEGYSHITVFSHGGLDARWLKWWNRGYQQYHSDLENLMEKLVKKGEPILVVMDHDQYLRKAPSINIPEQAIILITKKMDNKTIRYVKTPEGWQEQDDNIVFEFLRSQGITKARFTGEKGYIGKKRGCARLLAQRFQQEGFEVAGVKDHIYPLKPPRKDTEINRLLYTDAIKVI